MGTEMQQKQPKQTKPKTKPSNFMLVNLIKFLSREIKVTINRKVMKKCIRMKTGQIKSLGQSN